MSKAGAQPSNNNLGSGPVEPQPPQRSRLPSSDSEEELDSDFNIMNAHNHITLDFFKGQGEDPENSIVISKDFAST